jgi:hypothetical protein
MMDMGGADRVQTVSHSIIHLTAHGERRSNKSVSAWMAHLSLLHAYLLNCVGFCAWTGGYCPGGGRCWPLAGYWSWSEYMKPIKCIIAEACVGTNTGELQDGNIPALPFRNTQSCADGYGGPKCTQCTDGWYQLNDRCFSCGDESKQRGVMTMTIALISIIFICIAVGVAVLSPERVGRFVLVICILQTMAMMSVVGTRNASTESVHAYSEAASYFNMINFDAELVRPGCMVPTFNYVRKVQFTFALMVCMFALFFCATLTRLCMRGKVAPPLMLPSQDPAILAAQAAAVENGTALRQNTQIVSTLPAGWQQKLKAPTAMQDFSSRLVQSFLVLLTLFYLRVTQLMLSAFRCSYAPDPPTSIASNAPITYSLYLTEDSKTLCYTGAHKTITIVAGIILFLYSFGLPFFVFRAGVKRFINGRTDGCLGWLRIQCICLRGEEGKVKAVLKRTNTGTDTGIASPTAGSFKRVQSVDHLSNPLGSPSRRGQMQNQHMHAAWNIEQQLVQMQNPMASELEMAELQLPARTSSLGKMDEMISSGQLEVIEEFDLAEAQKQQQWEQRYGFAYVAFRRGAFFSFTFIYMLLLAIAAIVVFVENSCATQLLLASIGYWLCAIGTQFWYPLSNWLANCIFVFGMGWPAISLMTTLTAAQSSASESRLVYIQTGMLLSVVLISLFREALPEMCPCCQCVSKAELGIGSSACLSCERAHQKMIREEQEELEERQRIPDPPQMAPKEKKRKQKNKQVAPVQTEGVVEGGEQSAECFEGEQRYRIHIQADSNSSPCVGSSTPKQPLLPNQIHSSEGLNSHPPSDMHISTLEVHSQDPEPGAPTNSTGTALIYNDADDDQVAAVTRMRLPGNSIGRARNILPPLAENVSVSNIPNDSLPASPAPAMDTGIAARRIASFARRKFPQTQPTQSSTAAAAVTEADTPNEN